MSLTLFSCVGGSVMLPERGRALLPREDGGHLVVIPPRQVWERSELSPPELARWSALVAATGRAMLDALPQLEGGCLNYWEAGNWALHDNAEPHGPKVPRAHRIVHLHLLGRSRSAAHPSWRWGEAPRFPAFVDRQAWAAEFDRLTSDECGAIVDKLAVRLRDVYEFKNTDVEPWSRCPTCGYPMPDASNHRRTLEHQ
jgi:diadenosine tetraphosphate (Ap4A) HIT family hydrolase